ncbi:MAG TPA: response regulator [Pyrinomonadaceae bacterium]|jgi:CheY-like chemotaxis protein
MNRTIWAIVDDMFFASKIRATAEALGVTIVFLRTVDAMIEKLDDQEPDLVIFDLHNPKLNPVNAARELKARDNEIPLLGFFSHVEVELQKSALAAGFDRVIPRSVFSSNLADILKG